MTAHERAEQLMALLVQECSNPPNLRPSEISAKVEDAIRLAALDEREACAVQAFASLYNLGSTQDEAEAVAGEIRRRPEV